MVQQQVLAEHRAEQAVIAVLIDAGVDPYDPAMTELVRRMLLRVGSDNTLEKM